MCIIHDLSLHYIFQNIMEAFEASKIISPLFMKRVGYLLCTCHKGNIWQLHKKNWKKLNLITLDIYVASKSIIATQRSLYQWFDEHDRERLSHFKPVIEEFKLNGRLDSGTKIAFMNLLKDLNSLNFSQLRHLGKHKENRGTPDMFYTKLVRVKFDLKLCSAKEFAELLTKIDNCAIKYIQLINKCSIVVRDQAHLSLRHFMGEIDATIEAKNEKHLYRAELSLKRLADAVHYRLTKQIPSCDTLTGSSSFSNLKVLLQSPPRSLVGTPNDSTVMDMSTLSTA